MYSLRLCLTWSSSFLASERAFPFRASHSSLRCHSSAHPCCLTPSDTPPIGFGMIYVPTCSRISASKVSGIEVHGCSPACIGVGGLVCGRMGTSSSSMVVVSRWLSVLAVSGDNEATPATLFQDMDVNSDKTPADEFIESFTYVPGRS